MTRNLREREILGFERKGERPRQHELAKPALGVFESQTQLVRIPEQRDVILTPNMHRHRIRGDVSGRRDGRELSRMGDAFRPPSPAPFRAVKDSEGGGSGPGTRMGFRPAELQKARFCVAISLLSRPS